MSVLHIIPGPDAVLATAQDFRATRWCFECRERLPHSWFLLGDSGPSYYEPVPVCRCSRCGEDHTIGFGLDYDGPHYPEQRVEWTKA